MVKHPTIGDNSCKYLRYLVKILLCTGQIDYVKHILHKYLQCQYLWNPSKFFDTIRGCKRKSLDVG